MKVVALENVNGELIALTDWGQTFILRKEGTFFYWEQLGFIRKD